MLKQVTIYVLDAKLRMENGEELRWEFYVHARNGTHAQTVLENYLATGRMDSGIKYMEVLGIRNKSTIQVVMDEALDYSNQ